MSRETKNERFVRLAEARVNKIIKMIQLLGNLSKDNIYSYTKHQVDKIYNALESELDKSHRRFVTTQAGKKRFSLSENYEVSVKEPEWYPSCVLALPGGSFLRAKAIDDLNFPAINIYWYNGKTEEPVLVSFVEFNPERGEGHEVCIGVYCSDEDDTVHYGPYVVEENSYLPTETKAQALTVIEYTEELGALEMEMVAIFKADNISEEDAMAALRAGEYNPNVVSMTKQQWQLLHGEG